MQRHNFVQEKSLRPEVPFRHLLIYDEDVEYGGVGLERSRFQLTVYQKGDTILFIAHESPRNKGVSIGRGAVSIWPWAKKEFEAQNHICVQGHNGYYEYVNEKPVDMNRVESNGFGFGTIVVLTGYSLAHQKYDWSPAGTLQEVLERHLK